MQQQIEEENKRLKEKVTALEKSLNHIHWEFETICEFLENKGLTDEAAEFVAKQFVKLVDENNDKNDKENADYISA